MSRACRPGEYEIYLVPAKHNILAGSDIMYDGWTSTLVVGGEEKRVTHQGTTHSTPYDYDVRVPLVFHGDPYVVAGESTGEASPSRIAATLCRYLEVAPIGYMRPALEGDWMKRAAGTPRVVLVAVFDQVGRSYLDPHLEHLPFVRRLMAEGRVFADARLDYLPAVTSVSHATIGTGTWPAVHGILANSAYYRSLGRNTSVYGGPHAVDTLQLEQPTLADRWDLRNDNRAHVLAYSSALRASVGMAGHGRDYAGGDGDLAFWYDDERGFTTDEVVFSFPEGTAGIRWNGYEARNLEDPYWKRGACRGPSEILEEICLRGSPAFTVMEGDALMAALEHDGRFGRDDVADLVFISFKGSDYCGHYLGGESLECRQTLIAMDAQLRRIHEDLVRAARGRVLTVFTADHGVAPLTVSSGGTMVSYAQLTRAVNERFGGRDERPVVLDVGKFLLHIDLQALAENGHGIEEVKTFLLGYDAGGEPFFEKVLTYRDIAFRSD